MSAPENPKQSKETTRLQIMQILKATIPASPFQKLFQCSFKAKQSSTGSFSFTYRWHQLCSQHLSPSFPLYLWTSTVASYLISSLLSVEVLITDFKYTQKQFQPHYACIQKAETNSSLHLPVCTPLPPGHLPVFSECPQRLGPNSNHSHTAHDRSLKMAGDVCHYPPSPAFGKGKKQAPTESNINTLFTQNLTVHY